jgi:predicted porin
MKKSLIALAALSAFATAAQAQSSVTVYGVLSTGIASVETTSSGGEGSIKKKASSFGNQANQAGNRLGFRGTEDLGGGLTAGFVYELTLDMNAGLSDGTTDNRLGFVQLSDKSLGTLRAGRVTSLTKDIYDTFNAHLGASFAPGNQTAAIPAMLAYGLDTDASLGIEDVISYGGQRISNTVGYISPSFNGLTFKAQFGQDKTEDNGSETASLTDATIKNFGLDYAAGKFAFAIARDVAEIETRAEVSDVASTAKRTTDMAGATYDFGVAKAFLSYSDVKWTVTGQADSLNLDDMTVGVRVPMGKVELAASYSDGKIKSGADKVDTNGYQLHANYNLSKRTRVFAMYGDSEMKFADGKLTLDGYAVGVQHSF